MNTLCQQLLKAFETLSEPLQQEALRYIQYLKL